MLHWPEPLKRVPMAIHVQLIFLCFNDLTLRSEKCIHRRLRNSERHGLMLPSAAVSSIAWIRGIPGLKGETWGTQFCGFVVSQVSKARPGAPDLWTGLQNPRVAGLTLRMGVFERDFDRRPIGQALGVDFVVFGGAGERRPCQRHRYPDLSLDAVCAEERRQILVR